MNNYEIQMQLIISGMPASLIIMITKCLLLVSVVLDLTGLVQSFQPLFASDGNSTSHRKITIRAVLRKTAEVCGNIAATEGRDFTLTIDDTLTADRVQESCSVSDNSTSLLSNVPFHISIGNMYFNNANVDLESMLSEEYHFHGEKFQKGRDVITKGVSAVKASVKLENFITGRWILGQVCHTLQDFYSHSNWVELGNTAPYNALIKPYKTLENLAGPNISTCRNCTGDNCDDNILPDVLQQGLLTSGYFNLMSSEKPDGKCSHGGAFDQTSKREPVGGINKDKIWSSHGSLHHEAADLAENATVELLEEIRIAVGDHNFLRLMGLSQSSALCFVIDTTGSMSNDIAEAKRVSFNIIDRKRGTQQEPSAYILVPFNDPGFGPLLMTTDADKFKESINQLTANGGGDIPESSLSGLQLALTAAPALSQIFVFTDAPAKDAALKSTITALIESTKSEVTFMLTHVLTSRSIRTLNQADAQLYRDLAWASGGQAIEVSKSDLALATRVIEDSSSSAMVTVFQVVMNPGKSDKFTFIVDTSLRNITIYITGTSSLLFNLTSATGICQHSNESSGPLASLTLAGNLQRLILNNDHETGLWEISVDSNDTYSVKVTGQSSMNFIYNLVEAHEGLHGDFFLKEGRPLSGGNVTLLVTVVGCDSVNNAEITLHDSSGPADVDGTLQSLGGSDFLVTFNEIPAGNFVVRLKGEDSSSSKSTSSRFQRQVSTHIKTSSISLTAQANSMNIEPGSTVFIPFTVTTTISGVVNETATGTFTVRATNDRSFDSTSPTSVTIGTDSGGTANGTVTLTAPNSAVSGTGVSLMIEAEDADGTDINYVVLRFSIAAEMTDFNGPVCQEVSTSSSCSSSSLCYSSQWQFVVNVTDGVNGTGIERVTVRVGSGTLSTTTVVGPGGENITVASYWASCCAQRVELSVVDNVGNVGVCVGEVRQSTTVAPVTAAKVTTNTISTGGYTLSSTLWVWITVVALPLWK
ncbi:von Willebrand factor A domain-containing protein 7-like [Syngnathoides biaculeatus]|uniref:von Willebrand factor A domain-containing protein 7-like n=1 Tax=Syngnathoides biaculeatus TaxID=300417 RepID=UPI002ADDBFE7|nr:von Willebrand factor A domain-containing protein 7-like [Syngnathoides biaculeatus]